MLATQNQIGLAFDRIVLATDFTKTSEAAAAYARRLAKRFSSKLILAHVIDLSVATVSEAAVVGWPIDDMRRSGEENMERWLDDITLEGVSTTSQIIEHHHPASAVVNLAKEMKADLIITGTTARHGLSKAIVGSFAEDVIREAQCPVLTIGPSVQKPGDTLAFDVVVFATDLSEDAAEKAAMVVSLGEKDNASLFLCHILNHPGKSIGETLEQQLSVEAKLAELLPHSKVNLCSTATVVEYGDPAAHILGLAQRVEADVIVLGARPSPAWVARFESGVVEAVIARSTCPVLTFCSI